MRSEYALTPGVTAENDAPTPTCSWSAATVTIHSPGCRTLGPRLQTMASTAPPRRPLMLVAELSDCEPAAGRLRLSPGRSEWRRDVMKLITAVVRPETLDEVVRVVTGSGARGLTATEVLGFGQQHGHLNGHHDEDAGPALLPKIRLDIVVHDEEAYTLLDAIVKSAQTGVMGDGKLWLTPVESVVRVRTGDWDAAAV
jgi:nitrogen regulatory protein P-II 1